MADALGVDLLDDGEDLLHQDRRQAHRGLVEQQQLGPRHQAAADGQHLLLAARKRAAKLVQAFLQAREALEDSLHALADLRRIVTGERAHLQVLLHGQRGEDLAPLRHVNDAAADDLLGRQHRQLLAAQHDAARARPQQTRRSS